MHDVHAMLPFVGTPSRLFLAVAGIALLVAGRRVFWLAVGLLGFIAGYQAMERWGSGLPHNAAFVIAVAVGVIGMILAVVVQKVAVALAGFFLGVVLVTYLLPLTGIELGPWHLLVVAAGGLLMAFVALGLFSLALVVLTAGAGATMLAQAIAAKPPWGLPLLIVLWVIGVVVQRRTQT
ncbi:MAG TPA: hypothetical protein VGS57_03715 [Thermoanaerobaculia bacterium]|jgi:hypothetical protein|nr:hypothetical protein [Thermoanaerobaculia bacterium]